jgi:hypothetical protein
MSTLRLHAHPSSDDAFARLVNELLARERPSDPASLEALVRLQYPSARIVAQSSLAAVGPELVWYAYRDGSANGHH